MYMCWNHMNSTLFLHVNFGSIYKPGLWFRPAMIFIAIRDLRLPTYCCWTVSQSHREHFQKQQMLRGWEEWISSSVLQSIQTELKRSWKAIPTQARRTSLWNVISPVTWASHPTDGPVKIMLYIKRIGWPMQDPTKERERLVKYRFCV